MLHCQTLLTMDSSRAQKYWNSLFTRETNQRIINDLIESLKLNTDNLGSNKNITAVLEQLAKKPVTSEVFCLFHNNRSAILMELNHLEIYLVV